MGLKKAYCLKCNCKNEKTRIFEVNPDASVCYCPHCMAEYEPKEVIEAYNRYLKKQVEDAYNLIYVRTEFKPAYSSFAHILEIDSSCIEARFGRILSLIYLSTLRRNRFSDATVLLKEESALYFHKAKNNALYFKFLQRALFATNQYYSYLKKRLTIRGLYYNSECIKLMYYRVNEIREFKEFLYKEAFDLSERCPEIEIGSFAQTIRDELDNQPNELNEKAKDIYGNTFGLSGFSATGGVIVAREANPNPYRTTFIVKRSLTKEDKHTRLIKNQVFPDNTSLYNFIRKAIPWEIISFLIGTAYLVTTFIYPDHPVKLAMYILGGTFVSVTIYLVTFSLVGSRRLKKNRYLIS